MRSLLITLMLIVTVILVCVNVTEGEGGLKQGTGRAGEIMSRHIKEMSP